MTGTVCNFWGDDVEIRHFKTIGRTPLLPLAVRGWAELIEVGHHDGGFLLAWDQEAVGAFDDDGAAIGVLTWMDQGWQNAIAIALGYVVPERRRQGVHTAMWNALIVKARERGRPVILSGGLISNVECRAMMRTQGRAEYGFLTQYVVPSE